MQRTWRFCERLKVNGLPALVGAPLLSHFGWAIQMAGLQPNHLVSDTAPACPKRVALPFACGLFAAVAFRPTVCHCAKLHARSPIRNRSSRIDELEKKTLDTSP